MRLLKCPKCGEMFSDTYKTCPFCQEDEELHSGKPVKTGGRRVGGAKARPKVGGGVVVACLVLVLGLVACTIFGSQFTELFTGGKADTPVQALTLSQRNADLTVGSTVKLTASGGESIVSFSSSNEAVATVSADGTVKAVRNADEAYNNSEAVIELSGGGGYYVTGTLSEMELGSVKVGDTVSISSWMTGAACEGTIVSIDDYPTTSGNSWGDGNRNVSYYPFKAFVEEDAALQANDYVDIQYQKAGTQEQGNSLYLQSWFIRTDNGKSYVMARNEDGRLEQRWVQTGRDLWGSYTQIRGGLTTDDYLAFPYGRDVVEGARTVEAAADELYNDGL